MVSFNTVVATIVAVVIIYTLLGLILSYAWNNSVKPLFNTGELGIWSALMLLLTVHALTGGLHQTIQSTYNQNCN